MLEGAREVEERIEKLYAELRELRRYVITHLPPVEQSSAAEEAAWADLTGAAEEISASWTGPGAVDETRSQREK